jgi:hypothetical protein
MYLASEVTERQLAELAGNLVKEQDESKKKPWEELQISLGLSSADLFRHKQKTDLTHGECVSTPWYSGNGVIIKKPPSKDFSQSANDVIFR